jgi:arylsulfatase A-like enzyme
MTPVTRRTLLTGAAAAAVSPSLQAQEGGKLNLIHIGVDTWGADYVGYYGNQDIRTPHVNALLAKSAVFNEVYAEALPTLPCRRSQYTGRRIFPSRLIRQRDDQVRIRGWHPMYAEDVTLSETLQAAGYTTAIVSDLYHQFKPDKNFHRGFDSWRWIRGQEGDRLESGPRKSIPIDRYLHASQAGMRANKGGVMQYLLNRRDWKNEDDWLAAQVFHQAGRWLENNVEENQPFYLHIESFSPHEFWDPPEDYYRQYMKSNYSGPRLISPPAITKNMSSVEVEHARAMYMGLVTFVDSRIGRFLQKVESLGLMRNTAIVFIGDHGTMMGEQGQLHKGETRIRTQVSRVPLAVYHPRQAWAGKRIPGYAQHTDLMPTVLDLLGVKAPARVTGESLGPGVGAGAASKREMIVTGWGEHAAVRTPEWVYITRWNPGPLFEELYDVRRDPQELTNVAPANPKVTAEYKTKLKAYVEAGWAVTQGTFAETLA